MFQGPQRKKCDEFVCQSEADKKFFLFSTTFLELQLHFFALSDRTSEIKSYDVTKCLNDKQRSSNHNIDGSAHTEAVLGKRTCSVRTAFLKIFNNKAVSLIYMCYASLSSRWTQSTANGTIPIPGNGAFTSQSRTESSGRNPLLRFRINCAPGTKKS